MQRELLLIQEMIGAAERATSIVDRIDIEQLERDRLRAEALLWNFTVLGEAAVLHTTASDDLPGFSLLLRGVLAALDPTEPSN